MNVLLVCSMGMSSAITVNALKEAAEKADLQMTVKSISTQELENEVSKGWNIVMVAPQIRHRYNTLKEITEKHNIPCLLIEPRAYSPLGGNLLLKQITNELKI